MRTPKQINVGSWWGKLVLSASQMGIVLSIVTLFLAGIGAFPTVRDWAIRSLNWDLQLWQFSGIVLGVITVGIVAAHVLGMMSYMVEWSRQWWAHNNPLRKALEARWEEQDRKMVEMERRILEKMEELKK